MVIFPPTTLLLLFTMYEEPSAKNRPKKYANSSVIRFGSNVFLILLLLLGLKVVKQKNRRK